MVEILRVDKIPPADVDLDFFIYGSVGEQEHTFSTVLATLRPLQPRLHVRANVIDVFIKGQRRVQLIACASGLHHPIEVVSQFDLGHVQVFYDGRSVFASHLALSSLSSAVTVPTRQRLTSDRVRKAISRGFAIWNLDRVAVTEPQEVTLRGRFLVDSIYAEISRKDDSTDMHPFVASLPSQLDIRQFLSMQPALRSRYGALSDRVILQRRLVVGRITNAFAGAGHLPQHISRRAVPAIAEETLIVRTVPFRLLFVNDKTVFRNSHNSISTDDASIRDLCNAVLDKLVALENFPPAAFTKMYGRCDGRVRLTVPDGVPVTDCYDSPLTSGSLPKPGQWVVCDIAFALSHNSQPGQVFTARRRMPAYFSKRVRRIVVV
jgi:hypothetical protein